MPECLLAMADARRAAALVRSIDVLDEWVDTLLNTESPNTENPGPGNDRSFATYPLVNLTLALRNNDGAGVEFNDEHSLVDRKIMVDALRRAVVSCRTELAEMGILVADSEPRKT